MNLQPINPPSADPEMTRLQCSGCTRMFAESIMKADLDAEHGTYYCPNCAAHNLLLDRFKDSPIPLWTTYRTRCQRGRTKYSPDWSTSLPWCCYVDGTATLSFATLDEVKQYFEGKGMYLEC